MGLRIRNYEIRKVREPLLPMELSVLTYIEEHKQCTIKEIADTYMINKELIKKAVNNLRKRGGFNLESIMN